MRSEGQFSKFLTALRQRVSVQSRLLTCLREPTVISAGKQVTPWGTWEIFLQQTLRQTASNVFNLCISFLFYGSRFSANFFLRFVFFVSFRLANFPKVTVSCSCFLFGFILLDGFFLCDWLCFHHLLLVFSVFANIQLRWQRILATKLREFIRLTSFISEKNYFKK